MINLISFKKTPLCSKSFHDKTSDAICHLLLYNNAYHRNCISRGNIHCPGLWSWVTSSLTNYPGVRAHGVPWITVQYRNAFWSLTANEQKEGHKIFRCWARNIDGQTIPCLLYLLSTRAPAAAMTTNHVSSSFQSLMISCSGNITR